VPSATSASREASELDLTSLAALSREAPGQDETDQPTAAELLARAEAANCDESPEPRRRASVDASNGVTRRSGVE